MRCYSATLGRIYAALAPTVATFVAATVATVFPQCSSTVAAPHWYASYRHSPSKTPIYGAFGSNCSNSRNIFTSKPQKTEV